MKQYTFLTESKKKLVERLSRYTPEEISRIRKKLISLDKKNGGWYSPSEYGKKTIKGQINRIRNFSINPKPTVEFKDCPLYSSDMDAGIVNNNGKIEFRIRSHLPKSTKSFEFPPVGGYDDPKLNEKDKQQFEKSLKYFNNKDREGSMQLSIADVYGHEADELSCGVKNWIKWNKKHPDRELNLQDYFHLVGDATKNNIGGRHHQGVLKREAKRRKLLSTLYGDDSMFTVMRSPEEYAMNSKPINVSDYNNLFWD